MLNNKKIIFVAEIGMNHNGNFGLIYELIKQSAYAGADIAKFQLGWRDKPGEINCLTHKEIKLIIDSCNYFSIEPMFSIIKHDALKMISEYNLNYYKVASRTVKDDPSLVKEIINKNKTTFISLGMWDIRDRPFGSNKNIKYLWCKSKYPTYPWEMDDFPKNFNSEGFFGYSDHCAGIDMAILSIARGAQLVEKHFTLDKSDTTIRDHALSATPSEFRNLVNIGTEINKSINNGI